METRRWINQSQPQTLVFATFLLYFDAVFGLLRLLGFPSLIGLVIVAGSGAAGYGIANDRRWGYWLGVGISTFALLPYVLAVVRGVNILTGDPISLMFAVAQFALLVHPLSRNYQKMWFR